jgi:hypothetical protein
MDIKECIIGIILLAIIVVSCLIFLESDNKPIFYNSEEFSSLITDRDINNLIDSVNYYIQKIPTQECSIGQPCSVANIHCCVLSPIPL